MKKDPSGKSGVRETEEPTFEEAVAQLEEIVRSLETGQIGLEEALAQYERGIGLLKRCHGQLEAVEKRILELVGQDEEGRVRVKPFGHQASHDSSGREDHPKGDPAPSGRALWDEE